MLNLAYDDRPAALARRQFLSMPTYPVVVARSQGLADRQTVTQIFKTQAIPAVLMVATAVSPLIPQASTISAGQGSFVRTLGQPKGEVVAKHEPNRTAEMVLEVYRASDASVQALSLAAAINALVAVRVLSPLTPPNIVDIDEEGLVTLQWKKEQSGLLLIFSPQGKSVYSVKEPGGYYGLGMRSFNVYEAPSHLRNAIASV